MADIGITLTANAAGLQRSLNDASGSMQAFGRNASTSLKGVAAEATSLQGSMDAFAHGLKSAMIGSSAAVGLIGLKNSLTEYKDALVATQVQTDKMRNGLNFAVGKSEAAGEMAFIQKSAQALGLELASTSTQYTRLAAAAHGTTLAGQGVRDIFTAMGQAGTVMGLSAQEMDGALLAVTQMISKGKVQAEELRGQLGERLPGAFQVAARAMGVTTGELDKMLETGKVLASDFLPKFAAQLSKEVAPQVDEAAKSMQASINRLENSWTSLKRAVNESGVAKVLQNEMTGMGNYLQAVADAAANAKAGGGNGLSQASAALGNVIGRMPFDAVALTANTLNTALNALSGGALQLRTDFTLLPDVFKTNEQRIKALADALPSAQTQLAALQARLAQTPNNIYLKDEIYQLSLFIARAQAAKDASDKLKGLGKEDPTAAGIALGGQAREAYMTAQKQSADDMLKIKQKLSGVDADYLPTLEKLQRARELGTLTEKEYIATVSQLAGANFKKAAAEKVQSDTALQDLKARIITERQYIQALQDVGLEADKANEGEKLATKLTQELTGKLDAKTRASKEAQLVEAQILAIEIKKRDAIKDTLVSREKALAAASKELADDSANIAKINDRAAAIELEVAAQESLAKAVEQVAIARLKEQRDALKFFDNAQDKIDLIEEEIKARERLVKSMDSKESSDSVKKAAKEAEAEWKRASDEINRSITDALMRAFEDGSSFGKAFVKVIEAEFKTLVLRPIVSAVMAPISMGINSVLGSIGIPGVVAGSAAAGGAAGGAGGLLAGALSSIGAFGGLAADVAQGVYMGMGELGSLGIGEALTGGLGAVMEGSFASGFATLAGALGPALLGAMALNSAMGYTVAAKGNGLTATLGANGLPTGKVGTYAEFQQEGGLFGGGTTINRDWGVADKSVSDYINANLLAITAANKKYAGVLGLTSDKIDGFTKSIEVNITGLDAAGQQAAIDKELIAFASEQAAAAYGDSIKQFAREGESASQTVARLATDVTAVNAVYEAVGHGLLSVNAAGANTASTLLAASGGLANFAQQIQSMYAQLAGAQQDLADANRSAYELMVQAQEQAQGEAAATTGSSSSGGGGGSNALAEAVKYLADTRLTITQWLDKLSASSAGGLSQEAQRTSAWAALQAQMVLAKGGDRTALSGITGYADSYISTINQNSATAAEARLAIGRVRGQIAGLPNQLSAEQFIVNAIESTGGSSGAVATAVKALGSKLTAELTVSARSEIVKLIEFIVDTDKLPPDLKQLALASADTMTKTVSFITGSKLSDENKQLALETSSLLTKTINYGLGLDIPDEYKKLALKAADSIEKTISFTARNMLDPKQAELALMADHTIVKTIEAAAKYQDANALAIAYAQSETIRKTIEASGGVLTDDQAMLLSNIAQYNKQINLIVNLDEGALNAAETFLQERFNTLNISTVIQANDAMTVLRDFITAQTAGGINGIAVANVYQAARAYGFTQQDIATAMGYSLAEVQALFGQYNIPHFAVGTNFVPQDMLAMIHKGEAIVPAAYNPAAAQAGNFSQYGRGDAAQAALVAEIKALREDNRAQASAMVQMQQRMTKLIERWDGNGIPDTRVTA